jgi:putative ABC transport system permease protein
MSLFAPVAVAAAVLAVAAGSKPLFVSSAASAALRDDLVNGCRYGVGLSVNRTAVVPGVAQPPLALRERARVDLDGATRALNDAVAPIEGIDPLVLTLHGGAGDVATASGADRVQLVARTDAARHIEVLRTAPTPGMWLPDTVARSVNASAGDQIQLRFGSRVVPVTVHGVFRDLATAARPPYWCSKERLFEEFQLQTPPPVALFDRALLLQVLRAAQVPVVGATWEYAPNPHRWVLRRADRAITELTAIASATNNDRLPLGRLFHPGPSSVDQASTVRHAERAAATVGASAGPVSLGAAGVALLVLVLATRSWFARRRQELVILTMRGAGPVLMATKGVLEMATPTLVGAVVGFAGAVVMVRQLGPSTLVAGDAMDSAVRLVALAIVAALAALMVSVMAGVRRVSVEQVGAPTPRLVLWEPVALAIAAAALYELRTRGSSVVGETRVDSLVLLFPILMLAGGSGMLARAAFNRHLLRRGRSWPVAPWLALRRLAAGRAHAVPVVTGTAVAIGIVVFATTTSGSLRATVDAKATIGPGARQVLLLDTPTSLPTTGLLADVATEVTRTSENTVVVEGHPPADVLGVDPDTFARGAYWDASFASRSLDALLDVLRSDRRPTAAIVVGSPTADEFTLSLSSRDGTARIPVRVAARARAFPGYAYNSDRPLVVVNRRALTNNGVVNRPEVWADSASTRVASAARAAGLPVTSRFVKTAGSDSGTLQPQVWALQYLEVIGLAAGIVTLSGLGLYFAVDAPRRRAGTALARRFGMRATTSVMATVLETLTMLVAGLFAGAALAWVAIRLVFDYLDPLPTAPPDAILRFDASAITSAAAAIVVAAVIAALVVERRAVTRPLPELLRDAA